MNNVPSVFHVSRPALVRWEHHRIGPAATTVRFCLFLSAGTEHPAVTSAVLGDVAFFYRPTTWPNSRTSADLTFDEYIHTQQSCSRSTAQISMDTLVTSSIPATCSLKLVAADPGGAGRPPHLGPLTGSSRFPGTRWPVGAHIWTMPR